MKSKEIFLVGYHLPPSSFHTWSVVGIFDEECKARENCLDENHFYVKLVVNKAHHRKETKFHNCIYPVQPKINNLIDIGMKNITNGYINMEKAKCDYCGNELINILDIGLHPHYKTNLNGNKEEIFVFCCEKCRDEFIWAVTSFKVED